MILTVCTCLNKIYLQADKDLNEAYAKLRGKLDADGKNNSRKGSLPEPQ
jgi:uncharacterized protein YecT (DUF1311 family)